MTKDDVESHETGHPAHNVRAPIQLTGTPIIIHESSKVISIHQSPGQRQQGDVRRQAQRREQCHAVPRRPELLPRQRLVIALAYAVGHVLIGISEAVPPPCAAGARVVVVARAVVGRGGEELAVALVAAVYGYEHDGGAVDGKEGADGVELGREDLEDDEGEGELAEGGAHVGALEGALGGPDLDEPAIVLIAEGKMHKASSRSCRGQWVHVLFRRQHDGACPVKAKMEMVFWVWLERKSTSLLEPQTYTMW